VLPGRQAARGKLLPQISACLRAMRTALKLISVCVRARARVRVCVATCLGVVVVTDCVCARGVVTCGHASRVCVFARCFSLVLTVFNETKI